MECYDCRREIEKTVMVRWVAAKARWEINENWNREPGFCRLCADIRAIEMSAKTSRALSRRGQEGP